MTQTICFNLSDPRLYVSERTFIQNLSQRLITRTELQAQDRRDFIVADPRALEAQHHKLSRGDHST